MAKGEFTEKGVTVRVKAAKTQNSKTRDWAPRKAEELLKEADSSKKVELVWTERRVKVNGVPAFEQEKADLRGSFKPPYGNLALPK